MISDPSATTQIEAASSPTLLWLIVLASAIIAAAASTIIDNRVKGTHKQRPHNNVLLLNECLAEHQSAYLIFFIGLVTGTAAFSHPWVRAILSICIVLALLLYIIGVSITADHEDLIADAHICTLPKCTQRLPWGLKLKIIAVNLGSSVFLLSVSVALCFMTTKAPG